MNDRELSRAYDAYSDRLWEQSQEWHYKYEAAVSEFTAESKKQGTCEFDLLIEKLCEDEMFWLAVGSGNYSEIDNIKHALIEKIVARELN